MDETARYINPFTDFGFKRLFGTEFNKDLLIDFLNQVLRDREQILDLTYLNSENQGRTETDRRAVFDLYCETDKGEKIIVEVQNVRQDFFKDRSVFYATFPIQEQAVRGREWGYSLKAVYTIGILNFSFSDRPGLDRCLREVKLLDVQTHEPFYDNLTFIYLETPRFKKREDELTTHFDKWMYVLKNLSKLQERPRKLQERIFEKLFAEAEIAKLNTTDMRAYNESLKTYWDNYSIAETVARAKRELEEAQQRVQKAEQEKQESLLEIAKTMKAEGDSIEKIARITKLPKETIEKL
ncbi:MAG: Rpn family recombination-promoting nuclease/putative transposase [Cytophagales bacterium]|jgi:predicted transposase/invertase (TIGR01784 family)|nr:Rpn family recombination-promoting nuclease/putative transposase [Cytophagales bacterium]